MKRPALVLSTLLACSTPLMAQSNVTLYGIMDVGIRHSTNEGPAGSHSQSRTAMIGGGMSQSRWGVRGTEDLGGGTRVLFNYEQRVLPQTGGLIGGTVVFPSAWLAVENDAWGRVALGRQYNGLFDLYTSTFASFPYSPYFDGFKPEIGLSAGSRFNELIKYTGNFGQFRVQVEATLRGESDTTLAGVPGTFNSGGKGHAAFVRWADSGLALGAGYLQRNFGGDGKRLRAWTAGGSYRTGPWYFTTHVAQNTHNLAPQASCSNDPQCTLDYRSLSSLWSGTVNGGFSGPAFTVANKRQMLSLGAGYQLTPQLNLGAHYWFARQTGHTDAARAKAHFVAFIADYAVSKRSDAYAEVDFTKLRGDAVSLNGSNGTANGAKQRMGLTIGFRHRF